MYKTALAIVYWIGIIQYITEYFPDILNIYDEKIDLDKKCRYNFTSQLTFWCGLLFAVFLTIPKPNNYFLFSIINLQLVVTLGYLIQIHDKKTIRISYSNILFHLVGFVIAIYFMFYKLKHLKLMKLFLTFLLPLLYLLIFFIYHIIYREKKCEPEKYFNLLTTQGLIYTVILIFVYIFLSFLVDYIIV